MVVELQKQVRTQAVTSIRRYFEENLSEPIGELPAGLLLNFFLEEVGPVIYNKAIADAQARITARAADMSGELYADEFQYWPKVDAKRKSKR